ncbi:MAG: glycosyltransferase [Prevotella sp.]|nr:glycosyltransferase [Prevotella sp.]
MKESPVYSIIIPHHNIPKLLQRLLDSIPKRDDTEIIVVDDNSSPEVVDFSHFPGSDRHDVKLILDKKGGFGGYARNLGLNIARGEWLLFADSDDYFNYCIGDILDEFADAPADVIYFKGNSVDTDTYVQEYRSRHVNQLIDLFEKDRIKAETRLRYEFGEPWCKLIRHSLVKDNNIRFEERSIHNDTAFSYLVGYYARKIAVDKRALYCITVRDGSVSREISESKKLERIENFGNSSRFFLQHNIPMVEKRHFRQLYLCRKENTETFNAGVNILLSLGFTKKEIDKGLRNERIELLKERVKDNVKKILYRMLKQYSVDGYIVIRE